MLPQEDDAAPDLRFYLHVLLRRKWLIVAVTAVCAAAALGASVVQTPVYQATADVLIQTQQSQSIFDPNSGVFRDPQRAVQTEIEVIKSRPVAAEVEEDLGQDVPKVSASARGQTDIVEVSVSSTDPELAADAANAYASSYIDYRRSQAVETLLAAGEEIQEKVADLEEQIAGLDEDDARRQTLIQQQALFSQRLDQLQVDSALRDSGAQLVAEAEVPEDPVSPKPVRNAALALVVGLMLGVGLAFLLERLDETIKHPEDVTRSAPGLPLLALIPAVKGWKDRKVPQVISTADPNSHAAEAYRSLRTTVQFLGIDKPINALQVTSPHAAEGKSTTIANLAVALSRTGKRVVLVCCDLRRPRIHEFFGLTNLVGFTSVLLGEVTAADALQQVKGEPNLVVLSAGPPPPNPSELLSGQRAAATIETLKGIADVVLIDCPPILPVTDAAIISAHVDATILVVAAGETTQHHLERAVELLQQVNAPLAGIVLNGVKEGSAYTGSYAYSYEYSSSTNGRDKARAKAR